MKTFNVTLLSCYLYSVLSIIFKEKLLRVVYRVSIAKVLVNISQLSAFASLLIFQPSSFAKFHIHNNSVIHREAAELLALLSRIVSQDYR